MGSSLARWSSGGTAGCLKRAQAGRQGFWGEAEEQVAIRGASGSAQQGEGEDEGFGVEGLACLGAGQWVLLGELGNGLVDGACGQGAKRDGRVSAFHRVECTPPHLLFSNTLRGCKDVRKIALAVWFEVYSQRQGTVPLPDSRYGRDCWNTLSVGWGGAITVPY